MKILTSLFSLFLALPLAAQMPQPTAEHQKLAELVGVWDATLEYMGEDNKLAKSKGTCIRKQPMGSFWLVDKFQAQMMGQSFSGLGTTDDERHGTGLRRQAGDEPHRHDHQG